MNFTLKEAMNFLQKMEKIFRKHCPPHDYINIYDHKLDFWINEDFALWEMEFHQK